MRIIMSTLVAVAAVSTPAAAEDKWLIQPVQTGSESVRFVRGVPTVELERRDGVARLTPLPLDHGMLAFTAAVYNDGDAPSNFGIENVAPAFGAKSLSVLSKDQLVRKAKNRAFWSQFGMAMLGGAAAGLAASQRDVYTGSLVTPRGTYSSVYTAPSVAGQWQAAGITAGTAAGIALVQIQLDRTIQALGDEVVQTTTVDPGESYAGRLVVAKFDPGKLPTRVTVQLNWNGEAYPFTFQIAKPGTPAPVFTTLARDASLRDRRPHVALASPALAASAQTPTGVAAPVTTTPARQDSSPPVRAARDPRQIAPGVSCITCR